MSELFKNIVKLPPPHTARSYSELTPVYTADEVAKTVSSFEVELAKANERVKELEIESMSFRAVLDERTNFHPDTDPNYAQGFKDAMRLFEDIYLGEHHHALNKFALEQKIEALEECVGVCGFLSCEDSLKARIKQLRKGGES